jgi:3-oxoadipate enol-lactonase / 4-carboxymuconolactone decarboxylase
MIRLHGSVAPAAPEALATELLVLLPSLGTTTALWDGVVAELRRTAPALRVLRADLPGHGASPAAESFTIGDLAEATLRLVDEVGGGRFHVAGVSLGGTIALELAVRAPSRVASLAMLCSGARIGDGDGWTTRAGQVRASGTASLVVGSAGRWFAPGFLETDATRAGARALEQLLDIDDRSYAACCEALAAFDRTASVADLATPTLVVSGAHDPVTTSEQLSILADALPNGRFAEIADASHLAVLERPAEAAELIVGHVAAGTATAPGSVAASSSASASDPDAATSVFARGMRVRREVLGDAHVDRAIAATTTETAAFQDFITRYAWGEIWARPGLGRRERSIATLASLTTGGHEHELAMHVRAALRNGLSRDEIAEVLLHTALYAGLPAANAALAIARDVFAEASDPEASRHDASDTLDDGGTHG